MNNKNQPSQSGALQRAIVALDHLIPNDSIRVLLHSIAGKYDDALVKQASDREEIQRLKSKLKRRDQVLKTVLDQHNISLDDNMTLSPSGSDSGSDGHGDNDRRMGLGGQRGQDKRQQTRQPSATTTTPPTTTLPDFSSHSNSRTNATISTPNTRQQQQREAKATLSRQSMTNPSTPQDKQKQQPKTPSKPQSKPTPISKPVKFELSMDLLLIPSTITESNTSIDITPTPVSHQSASRDALDSFTYHYRQMLDSYQSLPLPPFSRHKQFIARFSQFLLDLYTASDSLSSTAMNDPDSNNNDYDDDDDDSDNNKTHSTTFTGINGHELNTTLIPRSLLQDFNWIVIAAKQFYNPYTYLCTIPLLLAPIISIKYNHDQIEQSRKNSDQTTKRAHNVIEPTFTQQNRFWAQAKELYHVIMAITLLICDLHASTSRLDDLSVLDLDGHDEFVETYPDTEDDDDNSDRDEDDEEDNGNDENDSENENTSKKSKKAKREPLDPIQQNRKDSQRNDVDSPYGLRFDAISRILQSAIPLKPLYSYHPFEAYFTSLEGPYVRHTRRLLNVIDGRGAQNQIHDFKQPKTQAQDDLNSQTTPIPTPLSLTLNPANFILYKNALLSILLGIEDDDGMWWDHFFGLLSTPLAAVEYAYDKKDDDVNNNNNIDSSSQSPPTTPLLSTPTAEQTTMTILTFWALSSVPKTSFGSPDGDTSKKTTQNDKIASLVPSSQFATPPSPSSPLGFFIVAKHSQQLSHITQLIADLDASSGSSTSTTKPSTRSKNKSFHHAHTTTALPTPELIHRYRIDIIKELALIQFSILLNSLVFSHRALQHHHPRPLDIALTSVGATILQRYHNAQHLHVACPFEFNSFLPKEKNTPASPSSSAPDYPIAFTAPRYNTTASQQFQSHTTRTKAALSTVGPIITNAQAHSDPITISEAMMNAASLIPTFCHCCVNHLATQIITHPFDPFDNHPRSQRAQNEYNQHIHPLFQDFTDPALLNRLSLGYKQQILFKLLSLSDKSFYTHHHDSESTTTTTTTPPQPIKQLDTTALFHTLTLTQMTAQFLLTNSTWHQSYMLLKHTILPWYSSIIHCIAVAGSTHTQCEVTTQQFVLATMQFLFLAQSLVPSLYNFVSYGPTSLTPIHKPSSPEEEQTVAQKLPLNQVTLVFTLLTQLEVFLDHFILSLRSIPHFTSIIQYRATNHGGEMEDIDGRDGELDNFAPLPVEHTSPRFALKTKAPSFLLPELQIEAVRHFRRYIAVLNATFIGSPDQYRPQQDQQEDEQTTFNRTNNNTMDALPIISLDPHTSTPSITLAKIFIQHTDVMREMINVSRDEVEKVMDGKAVPQMGGYETKFEFINHYLRSKAKHDQFIDWDRENKAKMEERRREVAEKRSENLRKARALRHATAEDAGTTTTTTTTTTNTAHPSQSTPAEDNGGTSLTTPTIQDDVAPTGPQKRRAKK